MRLTMLALALAAAALPVHGHMQLSCPAPRSASRGLKSALCGPGSRPGVAATVLSPGLQTIRLEETAEHKGAPTRLALSSRGDDGFEECILLNHIPHKAGPSTVGHYSLTVDIPDIDCKRCTLQVVQFMTDKMGTHSCTFDPAVVGGGECSSNYISCADVTITGSVAVGDFTCPVEDEDWPFAGLPANEYSKGEEAQWETLPGGVNVLMDAPHKFRDVTGACAAIETLTREDRKLQKDDKDEKEDDKQDRKDDKEQGKKDREDDKNDRKDDKEDDKEGNNEDEDNGEDNGEDENNGEDEDDGDDEDNGVDENENGEADEDKFIDEEDEDENVAEDNDDDDEDDEDDDNDDDDDDDDDDEDDDDGDEDGDAEDEDVDVADEEKKEQEAGEGALDNGIDDADNGSGAAAIGVVGGILALGAAVFVVNRRGKKNTQASNPAETQLGQFAKLPDPDPTSSPRPGPGFVPDAAIPRNSVRQMSSKFAAQLFQPRFSRFV